MFLAFSSVDIQTSQFGLAISNSEFLLQCRHTNRLLCIFIYYFSFFFADTHSYFFLGTTHIHIMDNTITRDLSLCKIGVWTIGLRPVGSITGW